MPKSSVLGLPLSVLPFSSFFRRPLHSSNPGHRLTTVFAALLAKASNRYRLDLMLDLMLDQDVSQL